MLLANNRRRVQAPRFLIPAPLAVLIVLGPALCLAYLWLGARCDALGKDIRQLEAENRELHRKCLYEESRWAAMKSPGEIEKALLRHNIAMTWPGERQIVRIRYSEAADAIAAGAARRTGQYAHARKNR